MKQMNWYRLYSWLSRIFILLLLGLVGWGSVHLYQLWNPGNFQVILLTTQTDIKPGTLVVSPYLAEKKIGFCTYSTRLEENGTFSTQVFLAIEQGQEYVFTTEAEIWIENNAPSARFLIAGLATKENQEAFEQDFEMLQKELQQLTQIVLQSLKKLGQEEFNRENLSKEWEQITEDHFLKTCIYAAMVEEILQRIDFWALVTSENLQEEVKKSLLQIKDSLHYGPMFKAVLRDSLSEGYGEVKRQLKNPFAWVFYDPAKRAKKIGGKMFEGAKHGGMQQAGEQLSQIVVEHPEIYKNPAWAAFWELQEQGVARNSLHFLSSLWNNESLMKHLKDKYGIKAHDLFKETLLKIKENPQSLEALNHVFDQMEPILLRWGQKLLLDKNSEQINPLLIALVKEKLSGQKVSIIYILPSESSGRIVEPGHIYDLRSKEKKDS